MVTSMLIRKEFIFEPINDCSISYNYQYEIHKNINYYISVADKNMEKFLNNTGYREKSGHIFKLYNFALRFKNVIFNDKIKLNTNSQVKLIISGKEDILKTIAKGLLHVKKIKLNDIDFKLKIIEDSVNVRFNKIMLYKTLSPIIETTTNDIKEKRYLTPYESEYYINLANNAKRKYELIYNKEYKDKIYFDIEDAFNIKKKSFAIKDGHLTGYEYNIWVEATPKMQNIIYYLGLGQNSSTGAGMIEYITGRKG